MGGAAAAAGGGGGDGAGGSGGGPEQQNLHEVIRFLRQEKEAALCQLEVLSLERSRWQRQAESARQEADQTRAALTAAESASGGDAKGNKQGAAADGESRYKALMAKVEHLNVVQRQQHAPC